MVKALIHGWFGKQNFGDDLMLYSTLSYFDKINHFYIPIDKKLHIDLSKYSTTVFYRNNIFDWIKGILNSNYIIFGGGGIIHNHDNLRDYIYWYVPLVLAKMLKKKVIIWSQTIGPIKNNLFDNFVLKFVVNICDKIYVRDKSSSDVLLKFISKDKIILMPDISLYYLLKKKNLRRFNPKKIILICPKDISLERWNLNSRENQDFYKNILKMIKILSDKTDVQIKLIALQSSEPHNDIILCEKIIKDINNKIKILTYDGNIDKIISEFNDASLIISVRLHGSITATALGVPNISLSYANKTTAFMKDIGLEDYCFNAWDFEPEMVARRGIQLINKPCTQDKKLKLSKSRITKKFSEMQINLFCK